MQLTDRNALVNVTSYCKFRRISWIERGGSIISLTWANAFNKWTEHNLKTIVLPLNLINYACLNQACVHFKIVYFLHITKAEYSSSSHDSRSVLIAFLLGWRNGIMVTTADIQRNLSKITRLKSKIKVILWNKDKCLEV